MRDPDLYAEIIRHDISMGVHEAQVICNIINKLIHIEYVEDELILYPLNLIQKVVLVGNH